MTEILKTTAVYSLIMALIAVGVGVLAGCFWGYVQLMTYLFDLGGWFALAGVVGSCVAVAFLLAISDS